MDPITIISVLTAARAVISQVSEQVAIARAKGDITEGQYQQIKQRAGLSEARWDEAVAAAKARLGG